ncbi:hypothetical protein NPIL_517041 [Nephila pilipes]|uniref:Uncharacterized protein n=1 Tax=Nephila pilipes TaxID=299642 RepID=A0A8X6MED0_NEPPI|nr:hypothetical protein NPIL_517041 [Nephila pilipes]
MINLSTKRTTIQLGNSPPTNHSPLCESPPLPRERTTIITVLSCHKSFPLSGKDTYHPVGVNKALNHLILIRSRASSGLDNGCHWTKHRLKDFEEDFHRFDRPNIGYSCP